MSTSESAGKAIATVTLYRVEPASSEGTSSSGNASATVETTVGTVVIDPSKQAEDDLEEPRAESEHAEDELNEVEIDSQNLYETGSVTIGRKEICDLRPEEVDNKLDSTVSRVHCIITASQKGNAYTSIEFTDMSSNATFINDVERITKGETRLFGEDFFLSIGRNIYDAEVNDPPRRFRIRCKLTPYGQESGVKVSE